MPDTAPITDANPTVDEMEARVARFRNLKPTDDYVDAAIPGCERTTLRVLGQQPHAPLAAEGFHMNLVCCEPGKSAPLHNHLTQEVFVALTGRWEVFWGPQGERKLSLEPWDTVSVPPGVSRGFRNVGHRARLSDGHGQRPGSWNDQLARAGSDRRAGGGRCPAVACPAPDARSTAAIALTPSALKAHAFRGTGP